MKIFNYKIMKIVSAIFAIFLLIVLYFPIACRNVTKPQTKQSYCAEIFDEQQEEKTENKDLLTEETQNDDIEPESQDSIDMDE